VREPVGQAALREHLGLTVPPPTVESYIVDASIRHTVVTPGRIVESYPRVYRTDGSVVGHLRFALKHEPTDLGVLVGAFRKLDPAELVDWVRAEPTGAYSRRAWFLYETFTGDRLPLQDAAAGAYAPVLDPTRHFVASRRLVRRQRVADNLPGGPGLCPLVRRTPTLQGMIDARLDEEARQLTVGTDPMTLERAIRYLYTKETRSSFALEGEELSSRREERFLQSLYGAATSDPTDKATLLELQGRIVDQRYAARDWRDTQIFVGEAGRGYRQLVHFIGPKPNDVPGLMEAWAEMVRRVDDAPMDPVVAATVISFAFLFVHPFEDGNGRIHRFLIHQTLARRGFSPSGLIFPVSAAILRDRHSYDRALHTFDAERMPLIDWHPTANDGVDVVNDTADLYRYFDATALAEYLYDRVADTVRIDLRQELDFVRIYDRALDGVRAVIDMPDRRASLLVQLLLRNGGHLSKNKRSTFSEVLDDELSRIEANVQAALAEAPRDGA
jgi:Fic/DOC family